MSQGKLLALIVLALVAVLTALSAVYVVDEREKVIVVRFGQILRHDDPAGIHFKVPFVERRASSTRAS
jgi:membrane protease subunit HflC